MDSVTTQNSELDRHMDTYIKENVNKVFNELNFQITESEISTALSKLKLGKACGLDEIPNEMLKSGHVPLLPVLHKLFNLIFTTESFPNIWRYNTLTPLHKKGDVNIPGNYRGIALTSNLCKLFCSVLHLRLAKYAEINHLIPDCQIGYRKRSRTSDHILSLKTIVDKYINYVGKARLFSCFVDFKSAFDTIPRKALLYKLLKMDIGGNLLNTIKSMYSEVFFRVKLPGGLTESFSSIRGVKQGCVLSPLLFNLFVGDLPAIFDQTCDPVSLHNTDISCLMFADDLVILSTTSTGLQTALDKLDSYCTKWGLCLNMNKTKVMIFNKSGHLLKNYRFTINNQPIEIATSYMYLGIVFSICGSFTKAVEHLLNQANKALFKLKQKDIRNNVLTALKLFDTLILPIIRYGSEVWGPFYIKRLNETNLLDLCEKLPLEKIQTKFCRYILGVHRKSTNIAVRAELGKYPLLTDILTHSAKYWIQLCNTGIDSMVKKAYLDSYTSKDRLSTWATHIQTLWTHFGLSEIWNNQGTHYRHKIINLLSTDIVNKYDLLWQNRVNLDDSKLRTYKLFKSTTGLENYLCTVNVSIRQEFTRLRISAHFLRIETGRHTVPKKTPIENRICQMCNSNSIEDEKHFILSCPLYKSEREALFTNLNSFTNFRSLDQNEKFHFIMSYNNGDSEVFRYISKFINLCADKRKVAQALPLTVRPPST